MFYGITDVAGFTLGTILIVLLPGPNSLYVMATASRWGAGPGYRAAAGVFAGDTVLMLLAATGMASLLRSSPELFRLIQYAGAVYLLWLGLGLLRAGRDGWRHARQPLVATPAAGDWPAVSGRIRPFRRAFVISLMNPKAILFFVSFFIQFVDPGYAHPGLSFLILGIIVQSCSLFYLSGLILAGAGMASRFRRQRRLAASGLAATGLLFIGFAGKLAVSSLG